MALKKVWLSLMLKINQINIKEFATIDVNVILKNVKQLN